MLNEKDGVNEMEESILKIYQLPQIQDAMGKSRQAACEERYIHRIPDTVTRREGAWVKRDESK
jgi:hypothetical protein